MADGGNFYERAACHRETTGHERPFCHSLRIMLLVVCLVRFGRRLTHLSISQRGHSQYPATRRPPFQKQTTGAAWKAAAAEVPTHIGICILFHISTFGGFERADTREMDCFPPPPFSPGPTQPCGKKVLGWALCLRSHTHTTADRHDTRHELCYVLFCCTTLANNYKSSHNKKKKTPKKNKNESMIPFCLSTYRLAFRPWNGSSSHCPQRGGERRPKRNLDVDGSSSLGGGRALSLSTGSRFHTPHHICP